MSDIGCDAGSLGNQQKVVAQQQKLVETRNQQMVALERKANCLRNR